MNQKRAFLISGAATLAALLLIGCALFARDGRQDRTEQTFAASVDSQLTVPTNNSASDSEVNQALSNELQVAYRDLDEAYREIERLRFAGSSREKSEHGDKHKHKENHDDDEDDE